MTTHLVQMMPDMGRLIRWAESRNFMVGDNVGYALHAALNAVFGEHGPKPFALVEQLGGFKRPQILGYASAPSTDLARHAGLYGEADAAQAIGLETLASKKMPDFSDGDVLGFEITTKPVVRTRTRGDDRRVTEHDAFIHAAMASQDVKMTPQEVYKAWLEEHLRKAGVDPLRVDLIGRRSVSMGRRDRSSPAGSVLKRLQGYEATFAGELRVKDPITFAAAVRSGIGRHRAFGYGMILLRPPAR